MDSAIKYGDLSDYDFKRISDFIYNHYGINLYPKKKLLVKSRLQKRIRHLGLKDYSDYCDFLLKSDEGLNESIYMIDRISTNKTDFFREADHFEYLTSTFLSDYLSQYSTGNLKIWSAGCSSGQEPYTIAMALSDVKNKFDFNFEIFASDISISMLKIANNAVYPFNQLIQIPNQFKKAYLLRSKDKKNLKFRINNELRNKVYFFHSNLLESQTRLKEKMDVIFCRNTLIYFDRETQLRVINNLLDKLKPNGYLFIGHSESLINMDLELEHVFPAVYKNINK